MSDPIFTGLCVERDVLNRVETIVADATADISGLITYNVVKRKWRREEITSALKRIEAALETLDVVKTNLSNLYAKIGTLWDEEELLKGK